MNPPRRRLGLPPIALLLPWLLPLLLLGACGGRLPEGFALLEEARRAAGPQGDGDGEGEPAGAPGLRFAHSPEVAAITVGPERRPAVLTTVDGWAWRGRVPEGGTLHAGVQLVPGAWEVIRGLEVRVTARSEGEREVLEVVRSAEREDPRWLDLSVDLSRFAGREVTLDFAASLDGLPPRHRTSNIVAWAPAVLGSQAGKAERRRRPNVLLIVVDTLRADRLTPYGYGRETSPRLQELLAGRGAVVERAYSQAPWTLPSVTSYLTSREPGEVLGRDPAAYGIPPGETSLAEALRGLGYRTAAFLGNATLHDGNGFGRGFETFYSPPVDRPEHPDAGSLNARARGWLAARFAAPGEEEPFFLYVHYMEPHDPYENPEMPGGQSPFRPGYRGQRTGSDPQGLFGGVISMDDPEEDVAHLSALYDGEIRYVDRFLGELVLSLPPEVLRETLIVFTSDHGEELYERGGWKHGFTLYDEQIRVPFLARWDGRIPAGSRLDGTARLLDLAPTLVRAAGGEPPAGWQGTDLLPALRGEAALPRRPALAEHLMVGPLRGAVAVDGRKLVLFNHRAYPPPADKFQAHLVELDLRRLERVELYDLAADPGERRNLAAEEPETVRRLAPLVQERLGRRLPGVRVVVSGLPPGSRLQGSLRLERPADGWSSWFLADGDRVSLDGDRVELDLAGDALGGSLEKGFVLEGDFGGIVALEARVDGVPLPPERLLLGDAGRAAPYRGGTVARAALAGAAGAPPEGGPALRLWRPARPPAEPRAAGDPETVRRLRALGYVQ